MNGSKCSRKSNLEWWEGPEQSSPPDVGLVYIQVKALQRMAHTMYILPTALREIFKFLLKSRNLK